MAQPATPPKGDVGRFLLLEKERGWKPEGALNGARKGKPGAGKDTISRLPRRSPHERERLW